MIFERDVFYVDEKDITTNFYFYFLWFFRNGIWQVEEPRDLKSKARENYVSCRETLLCIEVLGCRSSCWFSQILKMTQILSTS